MDPFSSPPPQAFSSLFSFVYPTFSIHFHPLPHKPSLLALLSPSFLLPSETHPLSPTSALAFLPRFSPPPSKTHPSSTTPFCWNILPSQRTPWPRLQASATPLNAWLLPTLRAVASLNHPSEAATWEDLWGSEELTLLLNERRILHGSHFIKDD